jgi:thiamine biosynthesis protein ThiS
MKTAMIPISLNGEPRTVAADTTVAALVLTLDLRPEIVAVEVNANLVRRADREVRVLAPGDRVEVVTLVGGG